jgi:hypothetical protein
MPVEHGQRDPHLGIGKWAFVHDQSTQLDTLTLERVPVANRGHDVGFRLSHASSYASSPASSPLLRSSSGAYRRDLECGG